MCNPMICIQRPGYSDIEGKEVSYEFMQDTLNSFKKPESDVVDGQYVLKLPVIPSEELPMVSIVTPTYNRRRMFALALRNFTEQLYPADKMEWVIVDDSDVPELGIDDLLPEPGRDSRINHIKVKPQTGALVGPSGRVSVAYKRNLGVNSAKHNIIIHMDDDDYYPPESVLARVKLLLKYAADGVRCVGCSTVGVYDLIKDASTLCTDGTLTLSEASMAYTRDFWKEKPFNDLDFKGEYFSFIINRFHQIMDVPYEFVICALTHNSNLTDKLRQVTDENKLRVKDTEKTLNFPDTWDEDTAYFVRDIARLVKRPVSVPVAEF
jgi:glycosyltransferase involved in cell wall biosynthesis